MLSFFCGTLGGGSNVADDAATAAAAGVSDVSLFVDEEMDVFRRFKNGLSLTSDIDEAADCGGV